MRYVAGRRYANGGGLTAKGRQRREAVRLEAAGLIAAGVKPSGVARRLRVSVKSAYQKDPGVQAFWALRGYSPTLG
jgi:hypothetical protein